MTDSRQKRRTAVARGATLCSFFGWFVKCLLYIYYTEKGTSRPLEMKRTLSPEKPATNPPTMCTKFRRVQISSASRRKPAAGMGYSVYWKGYDIMVRCSGRARVLFLQSVHTSSGTHPAFFSVGTDRVFLGEKQPVSWLLTSVQCRHQEHVQLYIHWPLYLHRV